MTLNQSALLELSEALRAADGGDLMRLMLGAMLQALVDAEATAHIGADPHQRTPERRGRARPRPPRAGGPAMPAVPAGHARAADGALRRVPGMQPVSSLQREG